jgi:hypothetical protein
LGTEAVGFDLGTELLAKLVECGTVFIGDDGVLGRESVGAGVSRRLALSSFRARSGAELGVGGVRDLAGSRHIERSFFGMSSGAIVAAGAAEWRVAGAHVVEE